MKLSLGKWLLPLYVALALIFLVTPIIHVIIYSFNDSRRNNSIWNGWTFDKWLGVCDAQGICEAFGTSVLIGLVATVIATVLGTLLAIALGRYRFREIGRAHV